MLVNIQGVELNLRRIEQIDSRLYNNEGTQHVIQELGSKYTNEQKLRKLFPSTGRHWQKMLWYKI